MFALPQVDACDVILLDLSLPDAHGSATCTLVPHRAGTVSLALCRDGIVHGRDEQLLADEAASHAALAIDNAWLYEQTRRAVQGRDELLAIASHDLRNPMSVMSLALNLIEQGSDAQRGVNLERVRRALDRMQRLIADLLAGRRRTLEITTEPGGHRHGARRCHGAVHTARCREEEAHGGIIRVESTPGMGACFGSPSNGAPTAPGHRPDRSARSKRSSRRVSHACPPVARKD